MFFCDKCHYLFNITKDVEGKQIGGKINKALTNLFNKFQTDETLTEKDLQKINRTDVLNDERFENMTIKDQNEMKAWIKTVNKSFFNKQNTDDTREIGNQAYFICKYCKNSRPIEPLTLIYSKEYTTTSSVEDEDYTYAVDDQTLARTRDYICKNPECKTHSDETIKEAVLTKNNNYQVVYICTSCSTYWTSSLH